MTCVDKCDISELDTLREKFLEKSEEVDATTSQIQRAKLDLQQLRLRLLASGITDASLIPANLRAGPHTSDQSASELGELLKWLAESVDLDGHAMFDVGGEIQVGERSAMLGRMVQWRLPTASGQKLSVPLELRDEIAALLKTTRDRGAAECSQLDQLAAVWEIVGAEISTGTGTEPAIFLINRETSQAMVVGCWPAVDFTWQSTFDPREHFQLGGEPLPGSTSTVLAPTGPQETLDAQAVTTALRPSVAGGDRVEVDYQGQWFVGTIEWVQGDMASVKCDADEPGVFTITPIIHVRPLSPPNSSRSSRSTRGSSARVRARSLM